MMEWGKVIQMTTMLRLFEHKVSVEAHQNVDGRLGLHHSHNSTTIALVSIETIDDQDRKVDTVFLQMMTLLENYTEECSG